MKVIYKCHCMAQEREIDVLDRPEKGDLLIWMEVVRNTIALDHNVIAPKCQRDTMEYAKIPIPEGSEQIGTPPRRH